MNRFFQAVAMALAASMVACEAKPVQQPGEADTTAFAEAAGYSATPEDTATFRDTAPFGYRRFVASGPWTDSVTANGLTIAWDSASPRRSDSRTVSWWERVVSTSRPNRVEYREKRLDCYSRSVRDGADFDVSTSADGKSSVDSVAAPTHRQLPSNGAPMTARRDTVALQHCMLAIGR